MHDLRADRFQKAVNLVDIAALTRAQAYVMQPDAPLLESIRAERVVAAHDSHRGPSAHAVEHVLAPHDRLEPEVHEQLFIKWKARLEIADREHHVRDAVNLHCASPSKLVEPCVSWMGFFERVAEPSPRVVAEGRVVSATSSNGSSSVSNVFRSVTMKMFARRDRCSTT